jgi:hypothetical protein
MARKGAGPGPPPATRVSWGFWVLVAIVIVALVALFFFVWVPSQEAPTGSQLNSPHLADVVPYAWSIQIGGIVCDSMTNGLRCTDRDGRRFFFSPLRVELF